MISKIKFTKLAQKDLQSIQQFIYENNRIAAKKVVSHIIEKIETLVNNPSIGRAGRVLGTRELVITQYPYVVPYQVKDDIIYILRILHTSRKWES